MKYTYRQLKKLLRHGDVILTHGNSLISKMIRIITLSYWNHAVMYVGKEDIVQSDKGGIVLTPLKDFAKKEIAVYRHRKASAGQLRMICSYARKQKGGYDWVGLVQLGLLLLCGIRGNVKFDYLGIKFAVSSGLAPAFGIGLNGALLG